MAVTEFVPAEAVRRVREHSQRPEGRPGPDVVGLHLGEPSDRTPGFVLAAMDEALRSGYTHYAHPQGDPELKRALAERLNKGESFAPDDIVITSGGSAALGAALLAVVRGGDRVVVPEPTYSLYADIVRLAGGTPVPVRCRPDLGLDLEAIEAAAPGARLVALCNPVNPTGAVFGAPELTELARIARRHDLLVLADEAYDQISYTPRFASTLDVPELADRLIYCQTFSKSYAMTGWRLGYVAAPTEISKAVAVVHRTFNSSVNAAVQRAGLAALADDNRWPAARLADYRRRRDLVVRRLAGVPGVSLAEPEGTFYAFVRYAAPVPAHDVVALALRRKVGLRAGTEFGESGQGHVRLSFSVPDAELEDGLSRLRQLFADLDDGLRRS